MVDESVSVREHLLALVAEADKRYGQRFEAQERATEYMKQITNEFRAQLADQQATFISRTESMGRNQANADKIDALSARLDKSEGRSTGLTSGYGWLVAGIAAVGALVAIFYALTRH